MAPWAVLTHLPYWFSASRFLKPGEVLVMPCHSCFQPWEQFVLTSSYHGISNTYGKCQHRDFIEANKIYDMKWCGKWDESHVIWIARSCHWSLGVMSLPFHSSPAHYFFPLQALYFFACLLYVLSISLLPYADILAISLLPRAILHSMPSAMFIPFHSLPRAMSMLFHC